MTNTIKTNLNEVTINFESSKRTEVLQIADLPIETIDFMLQGATRKFNDWVNTEAGKERLARFNENKAENEKNKLTPRDIKLEQEYYDSLIAECLERIKTGNFAPRQRNSEQTEFKNFVLSYFKGLGIKSTTLKELNGLTVDKIIEELAPKMTEEERNKTKDTLKGLFNEQKQRLAAIGNLLKLPE